MKSYKDHINEASLKLNTDTEMAAAMKEKFEKHFPNGWININPTSGIASTPYISISLGIVPKEEIPNKIAKNDPGFHSFMVWGSPEKYEMELNIGSISVKPEEGSFMAMGTVKTKFRKSKGTSDKLLVTWDKWLAKFKVLVNDNADNIYGSENYNQKYFK